MRKLSIKQQAQQVGYMSEVKTLIEMIDEEVLVNEIEDSFYRFNNHIETYKANSDMEEWFKSVSLLRKLADNVELLEMKCKGGS